MEIKITYKFIGIKYCASYGFVIFITDNWRFRILKKKRYG